MASSSAAAAPRVRQLVVPIFGTDRDLGQLPTALHSDARTTVLGLLREANGRGKPIALPAARAAAVDAALRGGGAYPGGVAALGAAIAGWRRDLHSDVSAVGVNQ